MPVNRKYLYWLYRPIYCQSDGVITVTYPVHARSNGHYQYFKVLTLNDLNKQS